MDGWPKADVGWVAGCPNAEGCAKADVLDPGAEGCPKVDVPKADGAAAGFENAEAGLLLPPKADVVLAAFCANAEAGVGAPKMDEEEDGALGRVPVAAPV